VSSWRATIVLSSAAVAAACLHRAHDDLGAGRRSGPLEQVAHAHATPVCAGAPALDACDRQLGRGGRSSNRSTRRERVLDVADLTSMPRGRMVVFASGAPAALARTLPWMSGPHAGVVRKSIRAHDPVADATLADAAGSLTELEALEGVPA